MSLSVTREPALFRPHGTRGRASFAAVTAGLFAASLALSFAIATAGKFEAATAGAVLLGLVVVNWVSVCVFAQRARDAGYNPWLAAVSIVPIGAFILWIVLMLQPTRQ